MSGRIPTPVPRYESGGDDEIAQEICELLKEMQTKMERDRSRCEDEHRESEECKLFPVSVYFLVLNLFLAGLHKIIVELKENIQLCKLLSSFKGRLLLLSLYFLVLICFFGRFTEGV